MKSIDNLRETTIKSLFWKFFERMGAQIIQFVISIILARILMPEDFGAVALVTVFVQVANVFVQSGLSTALIRKLNSDDLDASTVFYFSLFVSVIIYIILFFCAPLIADFYDMPVLKNVLRVLSLTIVIGSYNSMQNTMLAKKLLFKKLFISSFSSVLVSGVIGIVMAITGCGLWAIVGQQLSSIIITTIVMLFTVKWYPKLMFSFKRLKSLFSFGWKLLFSGLINVIYNNLYSLIIGKKYSDEDLAFWNRGEQFPNVIVVNINGSIDSVMYPVFSRKQNDKCALKSMVRRSIKLSAYLVFPMMMGLAMCAEPVVKLLLGEKWLFAVPFLQGWCFCYALMPIHTTNLQVYNALGRSDVFLGLEIAKKIVGIAILFITLPFGLEWMMFGCMIRSIIGGVINAAPNIKILKYSIKEQVFDLLPTILVTLVMGGVVYGCSFIPAHYVVVLFIQILVGVIVYFGLSALLKQESFLYVWNFIKKFVNKRENNMSDNAAISENKDEAAEDNGMKKLLLLGGSAQQIVAIEKAKELGYYTILCDYLSDNPGQYHADKFYLASTTDKELILKIAKENGVDGIIAYASDPAAPTAAYVAEELGLPTNSYASVDMFSNKNLFRKFLNDNGFTIPGSLTIYEHDERDIYAELDKLNYPIMVKPVDSSGSKGITKIYSKDEFDAAYKHALDFSRSKTVQIEEFIEKDHPYLIGGDIVVNDGKVEIWGLMNCHRNNKVNPLVPIGKSYPPTLSEFRLNKLKSEMQRLITVSNIKFGAFNIEVVFDKNDNMYIIDMGARSGGNMIPQLMSYIFDVDIVSILIKMAMGDTVELPENLEGKKYVCSYNLASNKAGVLDSITFSDDIKDKIFMQDIYKKSGDEIEFFDFSAKLLGIIFVQFDSNIEIEDFYDNIEDKVDITLEV